MSAEPVLSAVAVGRTEYQILREQAADLIASGYLPKAIDKPEKAVAIMMLGRELGMGPWQSFTSIDVIQGRPTLKPIGMAALVNRFVEARGGYLRVVESTGDSCTVEYLRPPAPAPRRVSFTTAEATAAGLMAKDTWRQYPTDMLRSRAISRACREGFSDVILGLYAEDEVESVAGVARPSATVTTIGERMIADGLAAPIAPEPDPDFEPDPVLDERTRANRRYHAIGASHGWTDAALHLFAVAMMPERPSGPTTSRSQLTATELRDLGTTMESAIGRMVDAETGEIAATPEVDFANRIAAAGSRSDLRAIGKNLSEGGHGAEWLRAMWRAKNRELVAVEGEAIPAEG